jgi:hypothetical protein
VRTNRSVRGVSIVGVFSTLLTVILLGSGEGRTKEETVRSTGTELVAVFIASSTCGGITDPRLEPGLGRAMNVLAEDARLQGHRFIRVGIALDPDPEAGLDVLNRFGPFDEYWGRIPKRRSSKLLGFWSACHSPARSRPARCPSDRRLNGCSQC